MHRRTKITFAICSVIGLTVLVLWLPVQALVMRRVCQMNYLRNAAFHMHMFSTDHNGMFPTNVAEVQVYASTAMHFHCPGRPLQSPVRWANINEWMDYIYVYWPEGEKTPHDYPHMYDRRLANHGGAGINIALVDGSSFWDGHGQWLRKFAEAHPECQIQLPEDMLKEPR